MHARVPAVLQLSSDGFMYNQVGMLGLKFLGKSRRQKEWGSLRQSAPNPTQGQSQGSHGTAGLLCLALCGPLCWGLLGVLTRRVPAEDSADEPASPGFGAGYLLYN